MVVKKVFVVGYGLFILVLVSLSLAVFLEHAFPIDTTILQAVRQLESPFMDSLMVGITRIGDPYFVVPLFFAVFVLLCFRKHYAEAKIFALNCLGGAVLSTGLKLFFGKVRPALWTSPIEEVTFSYPSGHALVSVVLYGFLAYLLGRRWPQFKVLIYVFAIVLALFIGFSRLYLGVHWPTDLVGGYIIGFLWTRSCIFLLDRRLSKAA